MATESSNIFEKHPGKTLVTIVLIAAIVLDFGAAAILKALGKFEPSYIPSATLEATYRKQHPIFHHGLAANIDFDRAEWGRRYYTVRTNSLGFKDSEIRDIPLTTDNKRIVLIGDSFTEGVGYEFNRTFAGILKHSLFDRNIELLNAAATSYSPIIYLRKTRHLLEDVGLKFDHLVVFIDLSDMEDEAKGYQFNEQGNVVSRQTISMVGQTTKAKKTKTKNKGVKEFLTQHTVLLGRIRNLAGWLRNKLRPWDRALNQRRAMWTLDDDLYQDYGKQGLALANQHMAELKALLDKHQVSLTIVVYPWPDQIYHADLGSRQVSYWQDWSTQYQVNFINLFPAFLNANQNPETTIKSLFIPGDVHWNIQGHQYVARQLMSELPFNSQ